MESENGQLDTSRGTGNSAAGEHRSGSLDVNGRPTTLWLDQWFSTRLRGASAPDNFVYPLSSENFISNSIGE
jgi:hypothetical protein